MTETITPFTTLPSESINSNSTEYPYLVVRIMSCLYQRERIEIRQGPQDLRIGAGKCFVQHPEPRIANNEISEGCRNLLLSGVSAAVNKTKFRMCIVWGEGFSSFVEKNGVIKETSESPSGGIDLPKKLAFDKRVAAKESQFKKEE
jgi:hypothetical protein